VTPLEQAARALLASVAPIEATSPTAVVPVRAAALAELARAVEIRTLATGPDGISADASAADAFAREVIDGLLVELEANRANLISVAREPRPGGWKVVLRYFGRPHPGPTP